MDRGRGGGGEEERREREKRIHSSPTRTTVLPPSDSIDKEEGGKDGERRGGERCVIDISITRFVDAAGPAGVQSEKRSKASIIVFARFIPKDWQDFSLVSFSPSTRPCDLHDSTRAKKNRFSCSLVTRQHVAPRFPRAR